MADFCKQCSADLFDEDFGDLRGLGDGEILSPGYGRNVICEGCGPTLVDDEGRCISLWCEKHGKDQADRIENEEIET